MEKFHISYNQDNFYANNHFMNSDGEFNYIAFLMSDQCDLVYKVVKWKGKAKPNCEFVYNKDFGGGCLLKTIDNVLDYMQNNINIVRAYFDGKAARRDEFLYSKDAFREAYINACIHNDYSTKTAPSVFIFDGHLEIFSYGSPLSVQSKEDFLAAISKPINPDLAKLMSKFDNYEESGKGVLTILRDYSPDVFELKSKDATSFTVSLPFNTLAYEDVNSTVKLSKTETNILELISSNNNITADEIKLRLGKDISTIKKAFKSLKDKKLIVRVGLDKGGHWEIFEKK